MNTVITTLLEVIKYSVPALIVFFTINSIMKKYLNQQYNMESLKFKQDQFKEIMPLKFQAYERLALFLERIKPQQLIFRLRNTESSADSLKTSLLIAVEKEYEHNMTQQVYVSDKLWQIVSLAKEDTLALISSVEADEVQTYISQILARHASQPLNPINQALSAIKKEVEIISS